MSGSVFLTKEEAYKSYLGRKFFSENKRESKSLVKNKFYKSDIKNINEIIKINNGELTSEEFLGLIEKAYGKGMKLTNEVKEYMDLYSFVENKRESKEIDQREIFLNKHVDLFISKVKGNLNVPIKKEEVFEYFNNRLKNSINNSLANNISIYKENTENNLMVLDRLFDQYYVNQLGITLEKEVSLSNSEVGVRLIAVVLAIGAAMLVKNLLPTADATMNSINSGYEKQLNEISAISEELSYATDEERETAVKGTKTEADSSKSNDNEYVKKETKYELNERLMIIENPEELAKQEELCKFLKDLDINNGSDMTDGLDEISKYLNGVYGKKEKSESFKKVYFNAIEKKGNVKKLKDIDSIYNVIIAFEDVVYEGSYRTFEDISIIRNFLAQIEKKHKNIIEYILSI